MLAGQTFLLGLLAALLVIPANGVFLDAYGAENLPWTYLATATVAILGTRALSSAVRRWPLSAVATPVLIALAAIGLGAWIELEVAGDPWVSAPLLTLFWLTIQFGFVIIGGQAGRVLDLREMKAGFARIVAGFPVGFIVAGLLATVLIGPLGGIERLVALIPVAAIALLALILFTRRHFPVELGTFEQATSEASRPPWRNLMSQRFVLVLLGYQVLSQFGTQLVEFQLYDRAAARYSGTDDLARFMSRFLTVMNLVDLLFLVLVAGYVLRRFGMRVGLVVNPVIVTVLVGTMWLVGLGPGMGSTAVFVIIAAARVSDISFTDGATRTALNTAYQALPAQDRLAAQATIEGLGVPVAIGLAGVVLLVLQQVLGVGAMGIAGFTIATCAVWSIAGLLVYRGYRVALRDGLHRRVLDPTTIDVDDPATMAVIDRLLEGDDDRLVWMAVTALGDRALLPDRLARLVRSASPSLAIAAFDRLVEVSLPHALAAAESVGADDHPSIRLIGAAILAEHRDEIATVETLAMIRRHLGDGDGDADVRTAAYRAAVATGDHELSVLVAAEVTSGSSASAVSAAVALARGGITVDALVEHALARATGGAPGPSIRLVRCLTVAPTPATVDLVIGHLDHPVREVGLVCRTTLAQLVEPDDPRIAGLIGGLLEPDAEHAARVLNLLRRIPDDAALDVLRRSLHDELTLLGQRVLATMALVHDRSMIAGAARQLAQGADRATAHAIETVEVHLPSRQARLVVPVIAASRPVAERLAQLRRVVDVPELELPAALAELATDPHRHWRRPWLAACAIHAGALVGVPTGPTGPTGPSGSTESAIADDASVREARLWVSRVLTRPA